MPDTAFVKLTRLCNSISSDLDILKEFKEEIEGINHDQIVTSMVKKVLRNTYLDTIGVVDEILPVFFKQGTITEIDLFTSQTVGIKCFFMSEGTMFPMHDHPNQVVVTAVLYGEVRYLCLNKNADPNTMAFAKKGTGKTGDIMFNTLDYRNVHTILAEENSVILDIFMHNINEPGSYYDIVKKVGKTFHVAKKDDVHFLTRSWKIPNCGCMSTNIMNI
jgi:PCO_ADO